MWLDGDEVRIRGDKIIEVAFQLFFEQRLEQVPMGQIVTRAGAGNRTMYRYFNNEMRSYITGRCHSLLTGCGQAKWNINRNRFCLIHERLDFFTHDIRGPCVAVL